MNMLRLALPLCLSSMLALAAILINLKIVGQVNSTYFYFLMLFMPINFFIIALCESLRVAASAYAASHQQNPWSIGQQLSVLCFIAIFIVALILVVAIIHPKLGLNIEDRYLPLFKPFCRGMILASLPLAIFSILSATLNGLNKQNTSAVLSCFGLTANIALNWYFLHFTQLNLYSLIISSFIIYFCLSFICIFYLRKKNIYLNLKYIYLKKYYFIARNIALPVWLSYMVLTINIWIFSSLLSQFGQEILSTFGFCYRIQNFLIMPAIALGIAIGILLNQQQVLFDKRSKKMFINAGLICLFLYILVYGLFSFYAYNLLAILSPSQTLLPHAKIYFQFITYSYLGLFLFLVLTMALDQIAYAGLSFFLTSSISVFEIILAKYLLIQFPQPESIYLSLAIGNILSGVLSITLFIIFHKKGQSHVYPLAAKLIN